MVDILSLYISAAADLEHEREVLSLAVAEKPVAFLKHDFPRTMAALDFIRYGESSVVLSPERYIPSEGVSINSKPASSKISRTKRQKKV